jgi:hypothetical protein
MFRLTSFAKSSLIRFLPGGFNEAHMAGINVRVQAGASCRKTDW